MKALEFRNVWFKYPLTKDWILKDVNLSIKKGECTLLIGPSGSGKSTIIYIARGLHKQFGGEIRGKIYLWGKDLDDLDFYEITRMGIGWVGQDPTVNLHQLTVRDEILSSPIYFNLPWDECVRLADDIMEKLNIKHLAHKSPNELSGGQQQRVAIAAALTMSSYGKHSLLLLDEPSSFLDPAGKEELIDFLKELKEDGMTLIISTHDIDTFYELADRIVLINNGEIVIEGDTSILNSEVVANTVGKPLFLSKPKVKRLSPINSNRNAIEFKDVCFGYNEKNVFENLNLTIEEGKFVSIIGNNGSGKTTLVKLALGLLKPKSGEIRLFGKNPLKMSAKELAMNVAYITQNPKDMFIANTVREECEIAPRNLGIKADIDRALEMTNLKGLEQVSVDSLSGGQKRLLNLASTVFVTNPRLIVLDEPEYGVHPKAWWEIFNLLVDLRNQGKTIIMLTHFIEATVYTDEVIVLKDGVVWLKGKPSEVFSQKEKLEEARIKIRVIE
jgi:energy-coupling factor transport system ATP-binding protein